MMLSMVYKFHLAPLIEDGLKAKPVATWAGSVRAVEGETSRLEFGQADLIEWTTKLEQEKNLLPVRPKLTPGLQSCRMDRGFGMTREESLLNSLKALQEMGLKEDFITAVKHIPAQEGDAAEESGEYF